jgi:hypothetical protein
VIDVEKALSNSPTNLEEGRGAASEELIVERLF